MPRYHFRIHDGRPHIDDGGYELPSLQAARVEAFLLAGGLIRDAASHGNINEGWRLDVADEVGSTLFHMEFTIVESTTPEARPVESTHQAGL